MLSILRRVAPFAALIAVAALPSAGQVATTNHLSIIGANLKPGDSPSAQALAEVQAFRKEFVRFPKKQQDWAWVIITDDKSWSQLLRRNHTGSLNTEVYGLTDLDHHCTYLRGEALLHPDNPEARPDRVVAHEMAHVYLNTPSETIAETTAQLWLQTY